MKLIRRGFTKNDGTFTIDATDFALRLFCFARSPNGDTRWSVWWTEWPTETECQVCHGACVVWNKHPSMPTTEAAFRWLKFFPNMFSKWEVCVYIYTYLVGGFKHFFHNIWDNPSHWLIFFKMVLKPPTNIYIYEYIHRPCNQLAIPHGFTEGEKMLGKPSRSLIFFGQSAVMFVLSHWYVYHMSNPQNCCNNIL